jgi:AcrR family transcriptional regulator
MLLRRTKNPSFIIMTAHKLESLDRRSKRTRMSLLHAFVELVLSEPYDTIQVRHIIDKADVGRSTFYEHFKSKDDLLAQSLDTPMQTLALACEGDKHADALQAILSHFWENRAFARQIFSGPAKDKVIAVLSNHISEIIEQHLNEYQANSILPIHMHANQIALAQLGLLIPWLTEVSGASLIQLTEALTISSNQLVKSCFVKK